MTNAQRTRRWLAPLAMMLMAGCAPAYHDYFGCGVPCDYCARPPLPYVHYEDCGCHSCAAAKYLSEEPREEEITLD